MTNEIQDRPKYSAGRPRKGEERIKPETADILPVVSMVNLRNGTVAGRVGRRTKVSQCWRIAIGPARELIRLADAMGIAESSVVGLAIHQMAVAKGLDIPADIPAPPPGFIRANVVSLEEAQKHYPPAGTVFPEGADRIAYVDPMNDPPRFADAADTPPSDGVPGEDEPGQEEESKGETEDEPEVDDDDSAPLLDLLRE